MTRRLAWAGVLLAGVLLAGPPAGAQDGAADGPCAWETDRYADCGNGTVTDAATGLIWLQRADCMMDVPVETAAAVAAALRDGQCGLADGSAPGDWRLPTRAEWEATLTPTLSLGCRAALGGLLPSMNDEPWARCFQELEEEPDEGAAFAAVLSPVYLASATPDANPTVATIFFLGDGDYNFIGSFGSGFTLRLWPVRGALR